MVYAPSLYCKLNSFTILFKKIIAAILFTAKINRIFLVAFIIQRITRSRHG
jgi:hypothetical protein